MLSNTIYKDMPDAVRRAAGRGKMKHTHRGARGGGGKGGGKDGGKGGGKSGGKAAAAEEDDDDFDMCDGA